MSLSSLTAGQSISAGDVVFVSASGLVYKACANTLETGRPVGIALDSATVGQVSRVNTDFIYPNASGLTPGEYQYLSTTVSGTYVNYSNWLSEAQTVISGSVYLTQIGRATSTTKLEVEIEQPVVLVAPL